MSLSLDKCTFLRQFGQSAIVFNSFTRAFTAFKASINRLDICPTVPTNKKPAAIAAGFVFPGTAKACFREWTGKQNGSDGVGTGFLG